MTDKVGRTALVTGASKGIGAAVARRLAHDGFAVIVNYAHGAGEAEALVQAIERDGGRALAVQGDVSDPEAVARLFDAAEQTFGNLTVVVNNAGIMELSPLAEVEDASFDRMIAINLKGVFNGLREAARRLPEGGRIISFSSSVVGIYGPTYGVYAAAKAAVEAMTHVLSKELGDRKINVNAIAPGPVETGLFLDDKTDEEIAQVTKLIPFGRLGKPEDIADVVSFLAGPDSHWITGQVLRANGGMI